MYLFSINLGPTEPDFGKDKNQTRPDYLKPVASLAIMDFMSFFKLDGRRGGGVILEFFKSHCVGYETWAAFFVKWHKMFLTILFIIRRQSFMIIIVQFILVTFMQLLVPNRSASDDHNFQPCLHSFYPWSDLQYLVHWNKEKDKCHCNKWRRLFLFFARLPRLRECWWRSGIGH